MIKVVCLTLLVLIYNIIIEDIESLKHTLSSEIYKVAIHLEHKDISH